MDKANIIPMICCWRSGKPLLGLDTIDMPSRLLLVHTGRRPLLGIFARVVPLAASRSLSRDVEAEDEDEERQPKPS